MLTGSGGNIGARRGSPNCCGRLTSDGKQERNEKGPPVSGGQVVPVFTEQGQRQQKSI
jgi:hypothetical protein